MSGELTKTLQLSMNIQNIPGLYKMSLGQCVAVVAAAINHSCRPNAHFVFIGRTLNLRILEDIPEGKEIYVTYIPTDQHVLARQQVLKDRCLFTCGCDKCVSEGAADRRAQRDDPVQHARIFTAEDTLLAFPKVIADSPPPLRQFEALMDEKICLKVMPHETWPRTRFPKPMVYHQMTDVYRAKEMWQDALMCAVISVYEINPVLFPSRLEKPALLDLSKLVAVE